MMNPIRNIINTIVIINIIKFLNLIAKLHMSLIEKKWLKNSEKK